MRKVMNIKLTKEYKDKLMGVIDETIDDVEKRHRASLTPTEKRTIKNLAIDQINVNVTFRSKLKSMWVLDSAEYLSVIVEQPKKDKGTEKNYSMKPNLTWVYSSKNLDEGVTQEEFEQSALDMLLEDAETSAFYGALSFITEE